jgi:hypothetical protein
MSRLKGLTYRERSEHSPLKNSYIILRIIFETDVVVYETLIQGGLPQFRKKTIDFLTNLLNKTETIVDIFPRGVRRIRDKSLEILSWVGEYWIKERK